MSAFLLTPMKDFKLKSRYNPRIDNSEKFSQDR